MNITTANRLVQYRKQRGYSQEELAAELGLSRQAVSKWERAEASPDTDNLIALARLYGVSLDELLMSDNTPQPAPQPVSQPQLEPQTSSVTAVQLGAPDPPAAPDIETILETKLLNEIADSIQDTQPPPASSGSRRQLSAGARHLLGMIGVAAFVVLFFVYGLLSLVFPGMQGAYPVLCTLIYLVLGFVFDLWHPGWLIYLTIPLYYTMFC